MQSSNSLTVLLILILPKAEKILLFRLPVKLPTDNWAEVGKFENRCPKPLLPVWLLVRMPVGADNVGAGRFGFPPEVARCVVVADWLTADELAPGSNIVVTFR